MTARSYLRSHIVLEQSNSFLTPSLGPVHWLGLSHFSGLIQCVPSHHFLPMYRNSSSFSNAFCSEYHTLYKVQNRNTANCITWLPSLIVKILIHHSFSFPQTCLGLLSRNSHLGRFFKFVEMFGFLTICFVIKACASFNSPADTKTILLVLFKEMPTSSSSSSWWQSEHTKYTNSGVDLQIFLENFAVKSLNNVNWMRCMHKEHLPLNFICMIFKAILTEKCWVVLQSHNYVHFLSSF